MVYWKVDAIDLASNRAGSEIFRLTYIHIACGNIDGLTGPAGIVDVADLSYLVAYLFSSGPPPVC